MMQLPVEALEIALALFALGTLVVAWRLQWLTLGATLIATLYGVSLVFLGGWEWVTPVLIFFISSSTLSVWNGSSRKAESNDNARRAAQVLANGGGPWLLLLIYAVWPHEALYVGFLGATAAATADTWSTEIGMMSKAAPRDVLTWQRAVPGVSGAVSALGTLAALGGAITIGAAGLAHLGGVTTTVAVISGGFLGAIFDSVLGATVQAKYRGSDGRWSDTGVRADPDRGWRWVDNNVVNWFCTATGAGLAVVIMAVF